MNFYQAQLSVLYPEEVRHVVWDSTICPTQEEALQNLRNALPVILPCMYWRTTCFADYDETNEESVAACLAHAERWFNIAAAIIEAQTNHYGAETPFTKTFDDEVEIDVNDVTDKLPPELLHRVKNKTNQLKLWTKINQEH